MLEELTARDIAEWQAYYELEPFGQDRQDAGQAITAYTVAVTNGAKDVMPADFLPKFGGQPVKRATDAEMLAKARAFVARYKAAQGGR